MKATVITKKNRKVYRSIPQRSIAIIEQLVKANQTDIKAMWKSFKTSINEVMSGARDFSKNEKPSQA